MRAEDNWMESVSRLESSRQKRQQKRLKVLTQSNDVDDMTLWLNFTGWKKLFVGKDLALIFRDTSHRNGRSESS